VPAERLRQRRSARRLAVDERQLHGGDELAGPRAGSCRRTSSYTESG
jgi:hypothetical protein